MNAHVDERNAKLVESIEHGWGAFEDKQEATTEQILHEGSKGIRGRAPIVDRCPAIPHTLAALPIEAIVKLWIRHRGQRTIGCRDLIEEIGKRSPKNSFDPSDVGAVELKIRTGAQHIPTKKQFTREFFH
ncbi:hypothetical protein GCM10022293_29050 [Azospirillum formosense]